MAAWCGVAGFLNACAMNNLLSLCARFRCWRGKLQSYSAAFLTANTTHTLNLPLLRSIQEPLLELFTEPLPLGHTALCADFQLMSSSFSRTISDKTFWLRFAKIFRNGRLRRDFAPSAPIFIARTSYRLQQRSSFREGIHIGYKEIAIGERARECVASKNFCKNPLLFTVITAPGKC